MPVSVELQLVLFSKVLLFERNLRNSSDDELVIGIVHQGSNS
jgi:hypothetical protein